MPEKSLVVRPQYSLQHTAMIYTWGSFLKAITKPARHYFADEFYSFNKRTFVDDARLQGNMLWLSEHVTKIDPFILAGEYFRIPHRPPIKIFGRKVDISRKDLSDVVNAFYAEQPGKALAQQTISMGKKIAEKFLFSVLMRPFMIPIKRTSEDSLTKEQQAAVRTQNAQLIENLFDSIEPSSHVFAFPEGTTNKYGGIGSTDWDTVNPNIRSGMRTLAIRDDVHVGYIGLSYDFMATNKTWYGAKNKIIALLNYSPIEKYAPLFREHGMSDEEYDRLDKKHFKSTVQKRLIDLKPITHSQIAGHYLDAIVHESGSIPQTDLYEKIKRAASNLREAGAVIDPALHDDFKEKRFLPFIAALQQREYATIIRNRIYLNPGVLHRRFERAFYKRNNPLGFSIREVRQLVALRSEVRDALQ